MMANKDPKKRGTAATAGFDDIVGRWKGKARAGNSKYASVYKKVEEQGFAEVEVESIGRVNAFRKRFLARNNYRVRAQLKPDGKYLVLIVNLNNPQGRKLWEEITG